MSMIRQIIKAIKRAYFTRAVKRRCSSCGENLRVNHKTIVTSKTTLGDCVNFNGMTIEGWGKVKIGNHFHSGSNCHVITHVHNYDNGNEIPYDKESYINKDVVIEDFVWLGEGVNILGGVTIGEGAIIQAYSTVVNSIPKCAIAGGHPAKVFKYRNIEHYEQLKKQGKYN